MSLTNELDALTTNATEHKVYKSTTINLENEELTPFMKQSESNSATTSTVTATTDNKEPKWTNILAFAGITATIGSAIPAGYCIGVMNSPAAFMKSWCNATLIKRYDLELSAASMEILWSAIVSIFLIGGVVGSMTGAIVANKYGRKSSFMLCLQLYLVGALAFVSCRFLNSVELLLLGRFIVGLAAGLTISCLPMYLNELAPMSLRGTLGVFCALGCTAGVVIGQIFSLQMVFGTADMWHVAISFFIVLVLACYVPARFYPESPKWLYIVKGDKNAALQVLRRLRGVDIQCEFVAKEIEEMELETHDKKSNNKKSEGDNSENGNSFCSVIRNPALFLPLVIVCVYMGGQQLSGINAIFFYSVTIFRRAGLSPQAAEWASLGTGTLNLVVSLFTPYLVSSYGRRTLMMFSSFNCALCLMCFVFTFYFIDAVSWFALACIACIFLYIFFFQFGLAPLPFFIGAELFEVAPRSVAMSIGSLSLWICSFIVSMSFPTLQYLIGPFVFLPFAFACFIVFLITKFYLPETRDRDPSEVAPLMTNGFKSKVI